jgi:hypothetical protein
MKRSIVFGSVATALAVIVSAALPADKTNSEQAFDRLASLRGEWKGKTDGVNTTLIYTLTANGSALVETCRPEKGPEMITMFTIDGDHLIATHYCSAKNQPQMQTPVIQEDNDHLTQEWSYEHKGKTGKNVFRFTRVREGAS